ncbi:hypothetical protein WDU94_012532 [Cyamophila willieti]
MFKSKDLLINFLVSINLISIISAVTQQSNSSNINKTSTKLEQIKCWNCSQSISPDARFCPYCKAIQEVNLKRNYFELYNLTPEFPILGNSRLLKFSQKLQNKFVQFQRKIHPTLFMHKSKREEDIAREHYAHMHKSYLVLQNPVERAIYLLSLHNVTIGANETATNATITTYPVWLKKLAWANNKIWEALKINEFDYLREVVEAGIDKLLKRITILFRQKRYSLAKEFVIVLRDYYATKKFMKKKRRLFDEYEEHSQPTILVDEKDEEDFWNDKDFFEYVKNCYGGLWKINEEIKKIPIEERTKDIIKVLQESSVSNEN